MSTIHFNIDSYAEEKRLLFGKTLSYRCPIYLDTMFWIHLRDAQRRESMPLAKELLDGLRSAVKANLAFCPMEASGFLEVMKQTDLSSRLETARLVDELSLGATLVDQQERLMLEIEAFYAQVREPEEVTLVKLKVWTKPFYVLGTLHPHLPEIDAATNLEIKRKFLDHVWDNVSWQEVLNGVGMFAGQQQLNASATKITTANRTNSNTFKTFQEVYEHELGGMIDLVGELAIKAMKNLAARSGIFSGDVHLDAVSEMKKMAQNLMFHAIKNGSSCRVLSVIHIQSTLHAAIRWNRGQKFKGNDFFDIDHATAALGYCKAYFTEGPWRTVIGQNHIKLDKQFGCVVVSDLRQALDFVQNLLNGQRITKTQI